jgi:hypothetical protein
VLNSTGRTVGAHRAHGDGRLSLVDIVGGLPEARRGWQQAEPGAPGTLAM